MKNSQLISFFTLCIILFFNSSLFAFSESQDTILPVRGLCIAAPGAGYVDKFVSFIENELATRHLNTLILRIDYNFQFKSHPELADSGALSKEDLNKIVAVCKKFNIKLIPQINLLGHQSWASKANKLLKVYPEFDETPWVKLPEKFSWPNPDNLYCKSYCPLHAGLHEILFSLIDEICESFQSDAFHAGMDEVFYLGESKCPLCGGRDKAELFADEVRTIRDHLALKNRSLWIWGDRLIDGKTTGMGEWEASYNSTSRAIDLIPKDVIICDWHYERAEQSPVYFAMKGLKVASCPYRISSVGIQQVKDMYKFRHSSSAEMQDRFLGVIQTVWSDAETFIDGFYGKVQPKHRRHENGNGTIAEDWNCFKDVFKEMNGK